MKKLLIIIPLTLGTAACVPMYATVPRAGYPPYAYRPPSPSSAAVTAALLPIGRWDNVMMQPHGAWLDVLTADGHRSAGTFVTASNDFVRLRLAGGEVDIVANTIVRVDRLVGGPDGKQSLERDAAKGAALGAGAVAVLGLAAGRVPPPRLFAAGAISSAYANAQTGRDLRASAIVYLAPSAAPRRE